MAVDGRAVTFGAARRGPGGLHPHPVPPRLPNVTAHPSNGQCTNHCIPIWSSVALQF